MRKLEPLPPALQVAIKRETQGEYIRWVGQPSAAGAFRTALPIWLMGVPWSAVTFTLLTAMLAAAIAKKPGGRVIPPWEHAALVAFVVFIGAFACIGVGMLAAPFWAAWKARKTAYAVTDRRLLTLTRHRAITTRSVPLHRLLRFERKERRDGSGTLKILTGIERDGDGDRIELAEELIGVPEVAKLERLLCDLQRRQAT